MSYRIDYAPPPVRQGRDGSGRLRPVALTACFFAFFALLVRAFWPEGSALLRHLLFGPRGESVLQCLETIADSLGNGLTLHDAAVGAFRDVLYGH